MTTATPVEESANPEASGADEFDTDARWTVESIERLGIDHALPAACRGSGGPHALAWLADWIAEIGTEAFLDVGAGLGGPDAWLTARHGIRPVVTEPMPGAVRGARRLFGFPAVQAAAQLLPFADGTFDAGWSLGVLSAVPDKGSVLAEMFRVLRPGARVGLVVYVAMTDPVPHEPAANSFVTWPHLLDAIKDAGFEMDGSTPLADLPAVDQAWEQKAQAVESDRRDHHGADARWRSARADEERVRTLLDDGHIAGLAMRLIRCPEATR